ncbi:hypothetical protein MKX01_011500 [Papaver californicum]|nr:hypothetical protein MKX01_011500 [Papaver californicum]
MIVKCISRVEEEFTRERSQDLHRGFNNFNPILRPLERTFHWSYGCHVNAVSCMVKNPNHLKRIFLVSMDGAFNQVHTLKSIVKFFVYLTYIRLWDIASKKTICQFPGHQGAVWGLSASTDRRLFARLWNVADSSIMRVDESSDGSTAPLAAYVWKNAFWAVNHQWGGDQFATTAAQVDIWDHNRSEPIRSLRGKDTIISLRFNPGEPNILATSGSDHNITLYDLWLSTPVRKLTMKTKTNALCWNPMVPMNFTAANEGCNCYGYDARKLEECKNVHKNHVSAFCYKFCFSKLKQTFHIPQTKSFHRLIVKIHHPFHNLFLSRSSPFLFL